ncbi:probable aspartyl aminopeptidase [Tanacetum coccineum]
MLATHAECKQDDTCDFELQACDTQSSIISGAMKEFIISGKLDNLCMSFCSLKAGSTSAQGAGSPVIFDALNRITTFFSSNPQLLEKAIQKSLLVSADMARALHPNYMVCVSQARRESSTQVAQWAFD